MRYAISSAALVWWLVLGSGGGPVVAGSGPDAGPQDRSASLGSIRIPVATQAGGSVLPAGAYDLRLTSRKAAPPGPEDLDDVEHWVEFVRGGRTLGRELAVVIPRGEVARVAKTRVPPRGSVRGELLRGRDYFRVWVNAGDVHYLIHLAVG